ncbi:MAG TPA: hypothetical protein VE595_05300 [Nitrososphaeraceae archaeon]|nr:hypothetical protein [Nitrososphaeraceae archaeon]
MKAIKHTNLKTLTVLAALLLLTVSLAIPVQESSAEKEKKGKDNDGTYQGNECSGSTCINIICQAAEVCIVPQDSLTRIALPT